MRRTGVFICWCGSNIAGTVDIEQVKVAAAKMPNVVYVEDNKYTCSEPGQASIQKAIKEQKLDRVVVAACSPRMHENTFRRTVAGGGLNPYLLEIANIREHCSWVHPDKVAGTKKAIDLIRRAVSKVVKNVPLQKSVIDVTKKALVIGGGIAGIQAALDIADAGQKVILVEKSPSIGGHMAQLDKTFPTLDCSACILAPKMVDTGQHQNITLMTWSEVEKVDGYIGNFTVTIRKKARHVDVTKCTGCGVCWSKCPSKVPSEFDLGLGKRKSIYVPFPQAIPMKPVIDEKTCIFFKTGKCKACQMFCPTGSILFDQQDELVQEKVGAIVVATGYDQWDPSPYGEYGYGRYKDVITGLEFERLINASGPTEGKVKRPSDGKIPETVAILSCIGSRDEAKGIPYCSKTCCMYAAKHAVLTEEKIHGHPYVFYMDVRTPGKGYEEFYKRATEEHHATYIRGRVSKIYPKDGKMVCVGEDTLLGKKVEVAVDLVVLASAMVHQPGASKLAQTLGISYDQNEFYTEAHAKLRPVETNTAGIFLAGACQGPKDIPETVAQASAAASKVIGLLAKDKLETEPLVATCNEAICSGCLWCKPICPYKAIDAKVIKERVAGGKTIERQVASVNASVCQGCGACTVACRTGAMNVLGFTNDHILAEVDALCL